MLVRAGDTLCGVMSIGAGVVSEGIAFFSLREHRNARQRMDQLHDRLQEERKMLLSVALLQKLGDNREEKQRLQEMIMGKIVAMTLPKTAGPPEAPTWPFYKTTDDLPLQSPALDTSELLVPDCAPADRRDQHTG